MEKKIFYFVSFRFTFSWSKHNIMPMLSFSVFMDVVRGGRGTLIVTKLVKNNYYQSICIKCYVLVSFCHSVTFFKNVFRTQPDGFGVNKFER